MKTENTNLIDSRFWISIGAEPRARKHTDKLLARIEKKGLTGIAIEWDEESTYHLTTQSKGGALQEWKTSRAAQACANLKNKEEFPRGITQGKKNWHRVVQGRWVHVYGEQPPSMAGWTLAARVTHLADAKTHKPINVFDPVPGIEIPERFRKRDRVCDHCKKSRLRKYTFICQNEESGKWVQVGSTCLRDFLGVDPSFVLSWYSFFNQNKLFQFAQEDPDNPRCPIHEVPWTDLDEVLLHSAYIVLTEKHVTSIQASEQGNSSLSTANRASALLSWLRSSPFSDRDQAEQKKVRTRMSKLSKQLEARIKYAKVWVRKLNENNTFTNNQKAILKAQQVPWRHWGYVAYWCAKANHENLAAKRKEEEQVKIRKQQTQRRAEKQRQRSQHFSTPGERIDLLAVKVLSKRSFNGEYGEGEVVKMLHGHNQIVWFGSAQASSKLEVDGTYDLRMTVKKHTEHGKWGKETQVNRVMIRHIV